MAPRGPMRRNIWMWITQICLGVFTCALLFFVPSHAQTVTEDEVLSDLSRAVGDEAYEPAAIIADYWLTNYNTKSQLTFTERQTLRFEAAQILMQVNRRLDAISIIENIIERDQAERQRLLGEPPYVAPPKDKKQASSIRARVIEYREYLGDLYFQTGQYEKAFQAYESVDWDHREAFSTVYEFASTRRDLFQKRYDAARRANLDHNTYCDLKWHWEQTIPFDDPFKVPEYWGTDPDLTCPRIAAGGTYTTPTGEPPFENVKVFYGTNRARSGTTNVEKFYAGQSAPLSVGSIDMTVPRNREVGELPMPGLFDFGGAKDGVHIVLKRITPSPSRAAFKSELSAWVARNPAKSKSAFVYVHGHGVAFANAARRTAQLAVDLDMRHGGIFYSWPTGSAMTGYFKSQRNATGAARELQIFLQELLSVTEIDELHVIAHSMGNDVLSQALRDLRVSGFSASNRPFGEIVWASPDVDAEDFSYLVEGFNARQLADGMTLYASTKDKALGVSSLIWNSKKRAGQAPPIAQLANQIPTVDTSEFDRSWTDVVAHSDFANIALDDMRAIIWHSLEPGKRCALQRQTSGAAQYWVSVPPDQACNKYTYRSALTLARAWQYDRDYQDNGMNNQIGNMRSSSSYDLWRDIETMAVGFSLRGRQRLNGLDLRRR